MNKTYLIILSMTAILGIGGFGMYASWDYSNPSVEISRLPEPIIIEKVQEPITEKKEKSTVNHKMIIKVVDIMIENYDNGGKELSALDKKLGFKITGLGLRYGFVIDENSEIVAHFNPIRVGLESYAMANSAESKQQIFSTLDKEGQIWIHYSFINPESDKLEPKTSLLKMHDGLIFGSGFYN